MSKLNATASKQEADWNAEADLRHLIEAEKIKKDKKRHRAAMKKHKEQMDALQSIQNTPNQQNGAGMQQGGSMPTNGAY